jgi:FKBP-type peptidyl-prolyl cis-trans isomerase
MKKLFSLLMVAVLIGTMASCNGEKGGSANTSNSKLEDSISLQFGELIGSQIKMMGDQGLEPSEILKGIEAAAKLVKNDTSKSAQAFNQGLMMGLQIFSSMPQQEQMVGKINQKAMMDQIRKTVQSKDSVDMAKMQQMQMAIQGMMMRAMQAKGAENDKAGKKYLEEQVKKDKGFKKTASGLAYKVVKEGAGENFNDSATVDVTYVGKHIDGKEFDSSKGKPVPFNLKMTVPGFREVISNMKPGTKAIAIIPGALAYGDQGNPQGGIGPNETLVFEITAIGVHKEEPSAMPSMPGRPAAAPAPKPAPAAKK